MSARSACEAVTPCRSANEAADRFGVVAFEGAGLDLEVELAAHALGCRGPHGTAELRIADKAEHRLGHRVVVALLDEQAADSVLHGFRDAAMVGGDDRETGGHSFEHRI